MHAPFYIYVAKLNHKQTELSCGELELNVHD